MAGARGSGVGAAQDAATACSGDPGAALGEIAAELTTRRTGTGWVVEGAGDAAGGSAARYEGDDTDTAQRCDRLGF